MGWLIHDLFTITLAIAHLLADTVGVVRRLSAHHRAG
jgi:hypothetical protein